MDRFSRLSLMVLVLACVASLGEAICSQVRLDSNGYRYKRETVPGAARVDYITVVTRHSRSACVEGASFGAYGADIWVNRGCRATFNVCYLPGTSRVVTCSSNNFAPARCNVPSNIRSVAVKQHLSNSPCVDGFSFRAVGSRLEVLNGCRARFVVGY